MDLRDYERFVKCHFPSAYAWCAERTADKSRAALAAQRIVLDLYRFRRTRPAHG